MSRSLDFLNCFCNNFERKLTVKLAYSQSLVFKEITVSWKVDSVRLPQPEGVALAAKPTKANSIYQHVFLKEHMRRTVWPSCQTITTSRDNVFIMNEWRRDNPKRSLPRIELRSAWSRLILTFHFCQYQLHIKQRQRCSNLVLSFYFMADKLGKFRSIQWIQSQTSDAKCSGSQIPSFIHESDLHLQ